MNNQNLDRDSIKNRCRKILISNESFSENIREILKLWEGSGLPINDQYYFVVLLEDETETIPRDNIKNNFSSNYLKEKAREEISLINFYRNDIIETMKEIIKLCEDTEEGKQAENSQNLYP